MKCKPLKIYKYGTDQEPEFYTPQCDWSHHRKDKFWCEYSSVSGFGLGYDFVAYINQYHFRGVAKTAADAEKKAWDNYQWRKPGLCKFNHHDPQNADSRGYENGCGFCKCCGHFVTNVFEEVRYPCHKCGKLSRWSKDNQNRWWCRKCDKKMPQKLWEKWRLQRWNEDAPQREAERQEKLANRRRRYRLKKIGPGVAAIKEKLAKIHPSKTPVEPIA